MLDIYDSTLPYRLGLAAIFFTVMGIRDWVKHPENPTRLREYLFLLVSILVWISYGTIHDHITATISPEYFLHAKGLALSDSPFRIAVTKLAIKATYGPGALAGALLLIANNPSPKKQQLPYWQLFRYCVLGVLIASSVAILSGIVSSLLGHHLASLTELARAHDIAEAKTTSFLTVWGIHTGSYLGAFLSTVLGMVFVARGRRFRDDLR